MAKRRSKARKKNGMNIHPSISGLSSGLMVASWLNSKSGWTATKEGKESVTNWLQKGDFNKAAARFIENGKTAFTQGQPTMIKALGIATVGAVARKVLKNPKIGGSKFYFRI